MMKSPLICRMSPLSRPVSKRTVRRKQVMSGTKEGPHKLHTQPNEPLVSLPTSDHDVSGLASRKSSGMKADAFLASVVSSKKKQDSANNQNDDDDPQGNDDDDPQGNDEIYLKSAVIKRNKSSPFKEISVASPRIQKQRNSLPFVSPGKRSLSRSKHGLDGIHQRRTVSMTIVDMKKLSEAIESRIGKQKKCEKVDDDTEPYGPDVSFTTSDRDVTGLSSSKSPVIETNELLADSSKNQEQHEHHKGTDEINLQPAVPPKKTSSASKTVASRSPRVQKGRNSMPFVSPGKRSLSRSMHGVDGIHRRRAVSMTTMDMKKLREAIESRVRKKKRNKTVDVDTQPHELEVSFTSNDHDVSGHLTDSSQSQEPVDFLQRIDEMYLKSEVKKRKNSCQTISVASRSPRVQKQRSSMPFVSPGKKSLSRITYGLDGIHRRRTVSMTTVDMKKLQEFIDCSQVRKKTNEKVDDETQPPNTSVTVNDTDFSGSSSSPGVEADDFLAGIVNKTQDSTRNLEHDDDYRRSNDSFHKCEVTKRKIISSCKKISAFTRSPRIQKQRNSLPFVSPGKRLLSRSMRGLDEIYRCRSLKKLEMKKLQQAIDLSQLRMKKKDEKVVQNPLHTFKSPSQKIKELVKTAVDNSMEQSDNLNCLKGRQSVPEPELSMQDKAVAPSQKENEENITHASCFVGMVISGKTPDLNFKKLDEMYESRFNPSQKCPQAVVKSRDQECTQADLDFEKLDEMYERWFNPSQECTEAVVDVDTVTRILSFQDEQTDSRSSSPPIIQRCAFAGDIIDPESDDISDSTVDEANKTLLEKEVSSFFEGKKGHSPQDFRKGAMTLDVASSCVQQETVNRVSENEPVTSTGAKLQSQNVPEHDDIMVIDENTYYRTPDSLQDMEDQATSPKYAPLAGRDHAMASTRYNFGESMPIDVEMDGQQDDICTPFQHSAPADPTHHPQSHKKTTSHDLLSAWAEIEKEKKLFVMYCHEDSAPCILKDLESCPAIIDGRSLSLRYLNNTSSVEVQGMVLKDEHITRPKKIPKENKKDAAKKKKKKGREKVLTVTGADGKKNDAPKRKKKSGTMKEMKKKKNTKVEARRKGAKKKTKQMTTEETNETEKRTEKEIEKVMEKGTKNQTKTKAKREKKKEPKSETEMETKKEAEKWIKKLTKKKTKIDRKEEPEKEMRKKAAKEAKKPMKKKTTADRNEPKSEKEKETQKETKKPTQKKTKSDEKKKLEKEMKNKARKQTKTGAEKETVKETKKPTKKKKEPKIQMQKKTKNEAMKETEKEAVNVIKKEMKKKLSKETTKKNKRIRVKTDMQKEMTKEVIEEKKEDTLKEKKKDMKKEVKTQTKEKSKKETKKGTTEGTKKETKKKNKKEINKGRKEETQKETKKETKKETIKGTKEGKKKETKKEVKKDPREGTKRETRKKTNNEKRKVTVSRDDNTGRLKIISGPITGAARNRNESRWEREIKQSETPWSQIAVQPSIESDLHMLHCLRETAWTVLKQREKSHINYDRDLGFEDDDDDSDLGTFINLVSFPDVFMTGKKDRPTFHKVPPCEIQILADGF